MVLIRRVCIVDIVTFVETIDVAQVYIMTKRGES